MRIGLGTPGVMIGDNQWGHDPEKSQSSNPGHGFEDAAIEALKKRRYKPATINGNPITLFYTATIDFKKP